MGLFEAILDFFSGDIVGGAIAIASDLSAKQIISEALQEALDTMESMIVNPGQETVYNDYIKDQFQQNSKAPVDDGWEDADAGDYSDFMSEIVEAGNTIMQDAYDYAQEIQAAAQEAGGGFDE